MATTIKTQFYISEKAMAIINSAASEKKRGEWLSQLVERHHNLMEPDGAQQECGLQEETLNRLKNIERQNALILATVLEANGRSQL